MIQTELRSEHPPIADCNTPGVKGEFRIVDDDTIARTGLEARVRSGFGTHFGACVEGFMPNLAFYEHFSGSTGVIGYRCAIDETLFLENYLDRPIEVELHTASGNFVSRRLIVEVGQLVIDDRNAVADFFQDLLPFLIDQHFEWVCFTATRQVRSVLAKTGFCGLPIAAADYCRVPHSDDHWGRYYDNDPVVVVGSLLDPGGHWCNASEDYLQTLSREVPNNVGNNR